MTTKTAGRRNEAHRREVLAAAREAQARRERRRRYLVATVVLGIVGGVVAAMMLSSRSTKSAATRPAPDFTLTDNAGRQVHLADYRGKSNVVLYFNEGAGCGACFQEMASIERDKAAFDKAGVTVLPIVMNTVEQLKSELSAYGVKTPYLLDDGTVSREYKAIGRGMHAGLPGHGFVLIDKTGVQRWYGEYPSMWLAPQDLLKHINQHLPA